MNTYLEQTYGRDARDLRAQMQQPTIHGARAALETFYHSFNNRSIEVFADVWDDDAWIALNNPLGGILHGYKAIEQLYRGIYDGPAQVWVAFHDIVEYRSPEMVVFAGRERGAFERDGHRIELAIRTSRVFAWRDVGWRQVHHHGSIDAPSALQAYQNAVRS